MKVSLAQEILSYLIPIRVQVTEGITTPTLGLYRYFGRWQLSAATALYSDGPAYLPLRRAFYYLKKELPQHHNMLVLGAGLGSAVAVLQKMGIPIKSTLVEIDPQIIAWGKQTLNKCPDFPCCWICADVAEYVYRANKTSFDIIVLDIFQDRLVPQFVSSNGFLQRCSLLLANCSSVLVFNYIINNEQEWQTTLNNVTKVFRLEHCIEIGINRILILRKIA